MPDPRRELGAAGEKLAERFLRRRGLRLLYRRFDTPVGELDLVMRDGRTIVFVEVKTLSSDAILDPVEHLRPAQQRRIAKTAVWLVKQRKWDAHPVRFDLVGVKLPPDGDPEIEHIPDAFTPDWPL